MRRGLIRLRRAAGAIRRWVKRRTGTLGPLRVLLYRGYGSADEAVVTGRVVEDRGVRRATPTDTTWRNVRNMYRRLVQMPMPRQRVTFHLGDVHSEVVSDSEGFVEARLRPGPEPEERERWLDAQVSLGGLVERDRAEVLVPSTRARFLVISDIDDTILPTEATSLLPMLTSLFTGNAYGRLPFPGVAAFYRALHHGGEAGGPNPMFYISRGPWNLYDLLSHFFELQRIPVGPVLYLRHWGLSAEGLTSARPRGHKFDLVMKVLHAYPYLPCILIGDSGQLDPEIYSEVISEHRQRVLAVLIRDVGATPERLGAMEGLARAAADAGSAMVVSESTVEMARYAAAQGWIEERCLPEIAGEKVEQER